MPPAANSGQYVATGASKWGKPKEFPWTMGFNLSYQSEGQIYAKWLLKNKPDAKIAILYQNDDYGKDVLKGVKDGLGVLEPVLRHAVEQVVGSDH